MVVSSDLDAIKRIVEAFERSDWHEIDVRSGNLRVHLASTTTPQSVSIAAPAAETTESATPADVDSEGSAAATPAAPVSVPPGAQVVTSPSPGIFWRAPEPGAPPFTDVGQTVDATSTLCIVEVMKLMNHLKAGISGRVVAIYVENGVAVAKDEPLFAIASEGSTP